MRIKGSKYDVQEPDGTEHYEIIDQDYKRKWLFPDRDMRNKNILRLNDLANADVPGSKLGQHFSGKPDGQWPYTQSAVDLTNIKYQYLTHAQRAEANTKVIQKINDGEGKLRIEKSKALGGTQYAAYMKQTGRAGEVIATYEGERLSRNALNARHGTGAAKYTFDEGDDLIIDAEDARLAGDARWINAPRRTLEHPTAEAQRYGSQIRIVLYKDLAHWLMGEIIPSHTFIDPGEQKNEEHDGPTGTQITHHLEDKGITTTDLLQCIHKKGRLRITPFPCAPRIIEKEKTNTETREPGIGHEVGGS